MNKYRINIFSPFIKDSYICRSCIIHSAIIITIILFTHGRGICDDRIKSSAPCGAIGSRNDLDQMSNYEFIQLDEDKLRYCSKYKSIYTYEYNEDEKEAIELLRSHLISKDIFERESAIFDLIKRGLDTEDFLDELAVAAKSGSDLAVRLLAKKCKRMSISVLIEFIGTSETGTERYVRECLVKLGRSSSKPIATFIRNAKIPDSYYTDIDTAMVLESYNNGIDRTVNAMKGAGIILMEIDSLKDETLNILRKIIADKTSPSSKRTLCLEIIYRKSTRKEDAAFIRAIAEKNDSTMNEKLEIALAKIGDRTAQVSTVRRLQNILLSDYGSDAGISINTLLALRDLATLGNLSQPAVPDICSILNMEDPKFSSYAADTIGNIGSVDCVLTLERSLDSRYWKIVRSAAIAIGKLGIKEKKITDRLGKLRTEHWSAIVKRAASLALDCINGGSECYDDYLSRPEIFVDDYIRSQILEEKVDHGSLHCECKSEGKAISVGGKWLIPIRMTGELCGEYSKYYERIPGIEEKNDCMAIEKVENGWFVGTTRKRNDEDGYSYYGKLKYVNKEGDEYTIESGAFHSLYKLERGYLHVTLSQLGYISKNDENIWNEKRIMYLPPSVRESSFMTREGSLILVFKEGGYEIERDLSIDQLDCRPTCVAPKCMEGIIDKCCKR